MAAVCRGMEDEGIDFLDWTEGGGKEDVLLALLGEALTLPEAL